MTTTLCEPREIREKPATFIDEAEIEEILEESRNYRSRRVRDALAKARELKGLDAREIAALMEVDDPVLLDELFAIARWVKEEIYGNRLVLFAPLYISNLCKNECLYCAFRAENTELKRKVLTQEEIAAEVKILIEQGHKRLLLVAGESYPKEGFNYILRAIDTIYRTKSGRGEIRRVNVNIAPLTLDEFKQLKEAKIGTYQCFQETYHRETYAAMHVSGTKRDYDWRINVFDRAMEAGIDDVGIGVLFGLYNWKFEMLAMHQHIRHLEEKFGVRAAHHQRAAHGTGGRLGHGVSSAARRVRIWTSKKSSPSCAWRCLTPASSCPRAKTPTRAGRPSQLGVSQISAGSRCNPGGYAELRQRPRLGAVPTWRPPLAGRSRA